MAWVNAIIQGVLTGGLYALFACGLSLMFGVMKVVNLAHGDLAVVAGYVAIGIIAVIHIPVLWSFVIVVPLMAALGYALQRTILQGALDRSVLTTLIVTFGLSVVIENGLLQFFTANTRGIGTGLPLLTDSFSIGSQIQIADLLVVIFAVAVVVLLGLQYFLSRSKYGRLIRAVADDKEAAQLAGADYRHVFGIAAAIAFGTVALGGISYGMYSQLDPTAGTDTILLFAFAAVVIGGLGSLWGTLLGGVVLGVAQQIGAQINISDEVLAGLHRVPRRPRGAPAGPYLPEGAVVSLATETTTRPAEKFRVTRSQRNVAWTGVVALIVVVVFAILPYIVYSGTTSILVQAFIVLTLASMWNLLAGYAGLVSVGQQAFVGLGAYFVLILAIHGASPFAALPFAAIGCGVAALPMWWLVSRLRSGYFAIATWVLAATIMLIIEKFSSIGGGTGMPLPGLSGFSPALLTAYTYWAGLAVTVVALAGVYLLLRGRLGLVLTAVRDDEVAARSSGARVGLARMLVFVVAGAGCGAAGAVLAISQLQVQPSAVFSVQWTAEMAFATIIGGLGTIEGPILGTVVYMVLQQTLASYNAWYLIVLGLVAIFVALFARRGLWGLVDSRLNVRLFPVGYWLRLDEERPRRLLALPRRD
jgi:branched-chain amino acid transport system permease protein